MAMKLGVIPSIGVDTFFLQNDHTKCFSNWDPKPSKTSLSVQSVQIKNWKMFRQPLCAGKYIHPRKQIYTYVCSMNTSSSLQQKMVGGIKAVSLLVPYTRRLILLRHAKSSWANQSLRDHDRPLSKNGCRAAASIAAKLTQNGWVPEIILCSDSMRTKETLRIMQQHFLEFLEAEVHFLGSYYAIAAMDGETTRHLQETICRFSKKDTTTIMCMGHNRGWEEAASILSGTHVELKTANAAILEAYGTSWNENVSMFKAFVSAGTGGWKLLGVVKHDQSNELFDVLDIDR